MGFPRAEGLDHKMKWKDRKSGAAARWRDYRAPLSAFLLESMLEEAMFSGSLSTVYCEMDSSGFAAIEDAFAPLDFPPHVYWPELDGGPVKWFGGRGVLIRKDSTTAWATGQTEDAVDLLLERVPKDWEWLDA